MTDEELEALLEELEAELRDVVQAQLDWVAGEFAEDVEGATELVAAAFSVSSVRSLWKRRVPRIMTALKAITRRSRDALAEELDVPVAQVPTAGELDELLRPYTRATQRLLDQVGDRMAAEATQQLAEGVSAGETLDELKARMVAVFSDTGPQLGPVRAQRIAMTEATRAWNAGQQAAAEAVEGPNRPLVKQWLTRRDERVRTAHRDANGQLQLLADPFDVAGTPMQYPGDPSAPADLTVNCRCIMRATPPPAERTASMAEEPVFTGAMVALLPSAADAERLARYSDQGADQLHATLYYLGEADDYDDVTRQSVLDAVSASVGALMPVVARLFGVAQWNGDTDGPVWVWNVGDDTEAHGSTLRDVHLEVTYQLEDRHGEYPAMPVQYSPWAPHVAITYGECDPADMAPSLGTVVFDRIRVGFGGEYTDFPLTVDPLEPVPVPDTVVEAQVPTIATWSTPDTTALAFENQQTGDGRVFAPGALYWDGPGPWPLMANDNFDSHDNAALAGAIHTIGRDGDRIPGEGVLYLRQEAGAEAAMLLAQGAPLGVSVDLDDVDVEMVDARGGEGGFDDDGVFRSRLVHASVLSLEDGWFALKGETDPAMSASGATSVIESHRVRFLVGPDGRVPASALTAAAGDPGDVGTVVDGQRSGDYLMRITRGRIRGATLVTIPAYADARIVLDDATLFASDVTAAAWNGKRKGDEGSDYERLLRHVRRSKSPVGPARASRMLGIPVAAVKRLLARAAAAGEVVRLTRGLYTDSTTSAKADHVMTDDRITASLTAGASGAVDLPVADRETEWDGDAAASRVFEWADGDTEKIGRAFAYRDYDKDPATKAAYKLGYADVMDGELVIVPRGVFAAQAAMEGARGGVDIPEKDRQAVKDRLAAVRAHVDEETGEEDMDEMQASAWAALADLPAMPAAWFREPTAEELPPGGPGVNYASGRIFGWVAQANEPHAGYAKRIVINDLGRIDTTHFLRQRFTLDDGTVIKAGAFTMNAGHHRDGAECETAACQFDDTRTVAGIVTVGMNERGMWFSGAAAPWMSEWDRSVFMATQPSYHLKQSPGGGWQLRAVLAVPVPGHSSPLLASAVVERSQLALTAAALMVETDAAVAAETARQEAEDAAPSVAPVPVDGIDYDRLADALVASMARAEQRRTEEEAELRFLLDQAAKLAVDTTDDGK